MTITARPERAEDVAAIRELLIEAFPTTAEADLVDALRASGDLVQAFVATEGVATDGAAILGHVAASRLDAPMRALSLAPLAVRPARRGRGIGSLLVRAVVDAARAGGEQAILVLGDPVFYRRFGFDAEAARGFDCAHAGCHLLALRLDPDCPVNGRVLYPGAFSDLG